VQDSPFERDASSPEILAIDFLKHGIRIGAILAKRSPLLKKIHNRIMSERHGSQERFLLVVVAILVVATVLRWVLRLVGRLR